MSSFCRYFLSVLLSIVLMGTATGCTPAAPVQTATVTPATPSSGDNTMTAPEATDDVSTVPAEQTLIGCDPASGRSQQIDLSWEQLCLSSEYQVQIAKDPDFTIIVVDTGAFAPADVTAPGVYYPAGGRTAAPSALAALSALEAGHTYYWRVRVRQAATGQVIHSPWSEVMSFTVKPGTAATGLAYGLQPLYPSNGCSGCPVKPASFSWSPFKDTTKYQFLLAKDAEMTRIVVEAEVSTTAYEYDGTLEYDSTYFWRVRALEPAPSDWSATFSFQTEAAPPLPAEPPATPATPLWVWVVITIGAVLIIVTIVLIFKVRRR